MEKFNDCSKNFTLNCAITVVVVAVVVYVLYRCFWAEGFANSKKIVQEARVPAVMPNELNETQRDIVINPPHFNPDTRTIMAGSGFIPQKDVMPAWGGNYGLADDLDDGEGGNMGLHYNLCSPSCCSAQYPTPHKLPKDPLVCGREDEFAASPLTCNNSWQSSGCLCLKKNQHAFLANRGNNTA